MERFTFLGEKKIVKKLNNILGEEGCSCPHIQRIRTGLVVQGLRLRALNAGRLGSSSGLGLMRGNEYVHI